MLNSAMESPFRIREEDKAALNDSEKFQAVRLRLQESARSEFCTLHGNDEIVSSEKQTFQLHRDILHALFTPLLQFLRQASLVAALAVPGQPRSDLELAFRGDARSAYAWLRCIVTEERNWCLTKGCPACVVLHVFQSEPLVRLIIIACRFPEYMRSAGLGRCQYHVPSFRFWLTALKDAVERDPFWDDGFWQRVESRATFLELGIYQLTVQCLQLRGVGSRTSVGMSRSDVMPRPRPQSDGVQLKLSAIALRQVTMKWEEQAELSKLTAGGARSQPSGPGT
ncbi:hypothetical protein D8B26_003026 [Coccidioides posadasii str. Silveira]|nr:hypothetical protein CPAG_09097 [Coccidioides posadasii RMSCC 3488]QVM08335.1 hypothetical protein D8B26_003026 [Coccidioides posadasii str. Silveira]